MDAAHRGLIPAEIGRKLASTRFPPDEDGAEDPGTNSGQDHNHIDSEWDVTWQNATEEDLEALQQRTRFSAKDHNKELPLRLAVAVILGMRKMRAEYGEQINDWKLEQLTSQAKPKDPDLGRATETIEEA
jgi:hypothetical protein